MKLVELLARELKEWPECVSITQDYDGDVGLYSISNPATCDAERAVWRFAGHIRNIAHLSRVASDHATAIVTRKDWSAERARIAKPAKKADKDGWIRHRGGKCPVDKYAHIEYRLRSGQKLSTATGGMLNWEHGKWASDIMAYRLHKPAEQVEACSKPEPQINLPDGYGEIYNAQAVEHGPLQWRDRIAEIDATTSALATERADLAQKLASEGFALIGRTGAMSDSKKWMVGDLFTVNGGDDHDFEVGDKVVLIENDGTSRLLFKKDGVESWVDTDRVEFHSRTSA